MDKHQLATITMLAQLLKDRQLEALRRAAAQQAQTRALIAGLEAAPALDLPAVPAAQTALTYSVWADRRRSELNRQLAAQLVELEERRSEASLAFGRVQALGRVAAKRK